MPRTAAKSKRYERYELARSPFAQKPTQRQLAKLLGMTRDELRRHASYKEQCIVRREVRINGKDRQLAYPEGPLRAVHEKLKFHLNKIKQPNYLYSPRVRKTQRDNAAVHTESQQFLTLDLKQFYPSTSFSMIKSWFRDDLGMYDDVAGLLANLSTVDGVASFGSPLTPVLVSMVHRNMFNEIADACDEWGLKYSVWVDDLTISGKFVPGEFLERVRSIISSHGLKSHKISYRSGNRPVFITGIGVVGKHLVAPSSLNTRIRDLWGELKAANSNEEKASVSLKLLAQLGTLRHIAGRKSAAGQRAANMMNTVRQKRDKWQRQNIRDATEKRLIAQRTDSCPENDQSLPWE